MNRTIFTALLGSTALACTAAMAQTATPPQQAATAADCDRLVQVVERHQALNATLPVTLEQARTFRTANNYQGCREALTRAEQAAAQGGQQQTAQPGQTGAEGSRIVVQQPAPTIQVQQASPQVQVTQPQPQVTVQQARPEITVRQPAPTVTVDIPQPEIIVRIPRPDVNVAMAQPQVEVRQPQPQVQVVQPQQPQVQVQPAQPQVQVQQQANAQPNVQVQQPDQQPVVRYERAEPQVTVNQAQGQPNVRFEQAEGGQQQQAAAAAQAPSQQGYGTSQTAQTQPTQPAQAQPAMGTSVQAAAGSRQFSVEQLEDMDVYTAAGDEIGEVDDVLIGPNNQTYAVVKYGGFLGIGERVVNLPMSQIMVQNDRLVVNMTEDQLRSQQAYDRNAQGYRAAENTYQTSLNPFTGTAAGTAAGLTAGRNQTAADSTSQPQTTGAVGQPIAVSRLRDMDLYNAQGQELGDIERVVVGTDNKTYAVIASGGFLGIGERQVAIPLERMAMRGDRVVIQGMTVDEIKALPAFNANNRSFRELGANDQAQLATAQ